MNLSKAQIAHRRWALIFDRHITVYMIAGATRPSFGLPRHDAAWRTGEVAVGPILDTTMFQSSSSPSIERMVASLNDKEHGWKVCLTRAGEECGCWRTFVVAHLAVQAQ